MSVSHLAKARPTSSWPSTATVRLTRSQSRSRGTTPASRTWQPTSDCSQDRKTRNPEQSTSGLRRNRRQQSPQLCGGADPDVTVEAVFDVYRQQIDLANAIITATPLDAAPPGGP